jgi:hypothetical protein
MKTRQEHMQPKTKLRDIEQLSFASPLQHDGDEREYLHCYPCKSAYCRAE